jgi:hypothetical protein
MKIKLFEGRRRKMTKGKRVLDPKNRLILACLILFLSFYILSESQELAWFCRPYGTVNYRGDLAPDGLKVEAFIQGQEFASCLTKGGEYSLLIPKDDPATSKKEGWSEEDIITLKVNGFLANPRFKAFSGTQQINLDVSTLDVPPTTWGKIKALFR